METQKTIIKTKRGSTLKKEKRLNEKNSRNGKGSTKKNQNTKMESKRGKTIVGKGKKRHPRKNYVSTQEFFTSAEGQSLLHAAGLVFPASCVIVRLQPLQYSLLKPSFLSLLLPKIQEG